MLPRKRNRRRYRKRTGPVSREYKLCVRLLPPNLTEEQFINTLEEHGIKIDLFKESFYYVQGHYSHKIFKKPTLSRAYIQLDSLDTIRSLIDGIKTCRFIDDLDNSMVPDLQISPFVKKTTSACDTNPIEGTILKDHVFQTFAKSWKLINEEESSSLQFKDLSVITPLRKELEREAKMEKLLQERKEKALIELAGDPTSEAKKKEIKRLKKKLRLLEKKKKKFAKGKGSNDDDLEKELKGNLAAFKEGLSKSKSKTKSKKKLKTKSKSKSKSQSKSKSNPETDTTVSETSPVNSKKKILLKPKDKEKLDTASSTEKKGSKKSKPKKKDKGKDASEAAKEQTTTTDSKTKGKTKPKPNPKTKKKPNSKADIPKNDKSGPRESTSDTTVNNETAKPKPNKKRRYRKPKKSAE